jgi:predicted DCC family thiol-disulfide oxidoreductase YuxK
MFKKPILIYDGECSFCRLWAYRWQRRTGDRIGYLPLQKAHARFPWISRDDLRRAVYLVMPDGTAYRGAKAVFRLLAATGRLGRLLMWLYLRVPAFARVSERCYAFVAAHRPFLHRVTRVFVRDPHSYEPRIHA